jgi:CheY-like chemotaxis protein
MKNLPAIFIDDDIEDLQLIKEMAGEMQFPNQVLTFNNPETALAFLEISGVEPLFIVCDINMPKMDGFQLRRQLLNSASSVKDVPFMFFSTMSMDAEYLPATELKVHSCYRKPNSFKGMKETLQSILSSFE